ncbi:MAG TPA: protein kinase [Kofleriaceae bacterium]|nr:protein kinase [Kofleriaceae bacterium]
MPISVTDIEGYLDRLSGVFPLDPEGAVPDRSRVIAGRYEIVERIGGGAMGQVVRVRHLTLIKEFAIKLMRPEQALDAHARERFVSEARLASLLSHPNIVSVVDFGDDPDFGLFIAMELVIGDRLSARITRGARLPVDICCRVARQLASALHHSHKSGIVHGDLKADNVVCVAVPGQDGEGWQVKLLDFGTARVPLPVSGRELEISGTPAYVAPERIRGNPPAASNDIYSLGVLLYEMLAGSPPFVAETMEATLQGHLSLVPEPVGARRAEVLDDALVAIVDRLLAKNPVDRYRSAQEVTEALDTYLEALGVREQALSQRLGLVPCGREQSAADAFDAVPVPVAGVDHDGTIRLANPAFAGMLGAAVADVEGSNLLASTLAAWHPGLRDDLRLVAMRGNLVRRHLRVRRDDGGETIWLLTMAPTSGRCGACLLTCQAE